MDHLPVPLHVDENPATFGRFVESYGQSPDVRGPVVGPFPFAIGVMDDDSEPGAPACRDPLEHLEISIGIAECRDRPAADYLVDADRLAGAVVDKVDLRQAQQDRSAVTHLILDLHPASDDLLGRDTVDAFDPGRMNSTPPPDTMNVLKSFERKYVRTSSIG